MLMSKLWLLVIVSFLISLNFSPALAQENFIVTVGQSKVFTEFNYNPAWFEDDPNNPPPYPPGVINVEGNLASVSLTGNPGNAGVLRANKGVQFNWNLGEYTWEQVKDWPVNVTVDFSYQISASYVEGFGSAHAAVRVSHFSESWIDLIGENGQSGSHSNTFRKTWTSTVGDLEGLNRNIYVEVYAHAHSVSPICDQYGNCVSHIHYSSAEAQVNSIEIEFITQKIQVVQIDALGDIPISDKNRKIIPDTIFKGQFDGNGKLILLNDFDFIAGVQGQKFTIKSTLKGFPVDPSWKPTVEYEWNIPGEPCPKSCKGVLQNGLSGSFDVVVPRQVGKYSINIKFTIKDKDRVVFNPDTVDRTLFVILNKPLNENNKEFIPDTILLEKATMWASGASNGLEVASQINHNIYQNSHWKYRPGETPADYLIYYPDKYDSGECGSFSNVWSRLNKVLGVKGIGTKSTRGTWYSGFVTRTGLRSLDDQYGNAHIMGGSVDRWRFPFHQVGVYKDEYTYYFDPTFGIMSANFPSFIQWNQFPIFSPDDSGRFRYWLEEGHYYYRIPSNKPFGDYEYHSPSFPINIKANNGASFTDNYSIFTEDIDNDGINNLISAETEVNVITAGNYSITGYLKSGENFITSRSSTYSIVDSGIFISRYPGIEKVTLNFSGQDIYESGKDGPYTLDLVLLDENGFIIDNVSINTTPYSHDQFGEFPGEIRGSLDYRIDTDSNGLYDYLIANVSINLTRPITYILEGVLYSNEKLIADAYSSDALEAGNRTLILKFDGTEIRKSNTDGPYTLITYLYDENFSKISEREYATSAYNYSDFQQSSVSILDTFSDNGNDTDGDGLYNYLRLDAEVNVSIPGNYSIIGWLSNSSGVIDIIWDTTYLHLDSGVNSLQLNFDGDAIHNQGLNGPYSLSYIALFDENGTLIDSRRNAYTTFAYKYNDFQRFGVKTINNCTSISTPGEYVLSQDIGNFTEDTCIRMTSNDVVLDGSNYIISNSAFTDTIGVYAHNDSNPISNITVKNLQVMNLGQGIFFNNTNNGTIANNTILNNSVFSILIESSLNNTIEKNNVSFNERGIRIFSSHNNTLRYNKANNNNFSGIKLNDESTHNNILDNIASYNQWEGGIVLDLQSNYNTINNNSAISNNGNGIKLNDSSNNNLSNNTATLNLNDGIKLADSSNNNLLSKNNISFNEERGIWIIDSHYNILDKNIINFTNFSGIKIDEGSSFNQIVGNIVNNSRDGSGIVLSKWSTNNTIEGNFLTSNNAAGINIFTHSNNNNVSNNNVTLNKGAGIVLENSSNINKLEYNLVKLNGRGILFFDSDNNIIANNNIDSNYDYGIDLNNSNNNRIYHNNLIYNFNQATDNTGTNFWNDSYPSGGNYWSNYNGEDNFQGPNQDMPGNDGIGDISKNINASAGVQDYYPFMKPNGWNAFSSPCNQLPVPEIQQTITHDGNLILSGNDTMLIENTKYIVNGNIYISGRAHLILRNSIIEVINYPRQEIVVNDSAILEVDNVVFQSFIHSSFQGHSNFTMNNVFLINLIDANEQAQGTIRNSCIFQDRFGLVQAGAQAVVQIENSTVGAIGLFLTPQYPINIDNLVPGYFEHWSARENISSTLGYNIILNRTEIQENPGYSGGYEMGWNIFAQSEMNMNITNSVLNKLVIFYHDENVNINNLKRMQPNDFDSRSIHLRNTEVQGQWGIFTNNAETHINDSDGVWLWPVGTKNIYVTNTSVNEFDPRQYSGNVVYINASMTDGFEVFDNSVFRMEGSVRMLETSPTFSQDSIMTRNYIITLFNGRSGTPLSNITLSLTKNGITIWSGMTDTNGQANFDLSFDIYNNRDNWVLSSTDTSVDLNKTINIKTSTPVLIPLEQSYTGNRLIYVTYVNCNAASYGDGTINYPYTSIQKGIDNSGAGGLVKVSAGTCRENVNLKDGIFLLGAGPDVTTIEGNVFAWNINNARITNFTITDTDTAGIHSYNSSLVITNDIIRNQPHNGIHSFNSSLTIYNNVLSDNGHNGIWLINSSIATIRNNIVANNGLYGISSDGTSSALVDYNDIWNNTVGGESGGISGGTHDIHLDPLFIAPNNFKLLPSSPAIDAGDPNPVFNDMDGSRNDMGAFGGLKLSAQPIQIMNPSANPSVILNDNGRARPSGTNITRLNATITGNVSSVTIDLSPIGGSAIAPMTRIPGTDIYTITTNATAGINLTNNLTVNATDAIGNFNNSVSIQLTVLLRGDIVRDNKIDLKDLLFLRRYLAGLEPSINPLVADIQPAEGDGKVDLKDLLFLRRYLAGQEPLI